MTKHKTKQSKQSKKTKHNIKNTQTLYPVKINLTEKQIEILLLYSSIINHFLFLMKNDIPKPIIKKTIISLFKDLRNHNQFINKNTTDKQLDIIFNKLYLSIKILKDKIDKEYKNNSKKTILKSSISKSSISKSSISKSNKYNGGFYFKSLEEKGDQPLTGNDLATLLDEIQQFFYNAQYTDEGQFLQDTNAVISMFRGDLGQFKGLLQYRIFPKYYSVIPPFIKWNESREGAQDGIKYALTHRKYEDIPDYLLAYQSYLRSRDEYLVAKGLKAPSVLGQDRYTGFFNKLANSLDKNITQFQRYRNKLSGKFFPMALTV